MSIIPLTHSVVVYHDNCCDGFGAAWAHHIYNYKSAVYHPMSYGDSIDKLKALIESQTSDKYGSPNLYILDFSLPREQLLELSTLCHTVTLIDHHKTAIEDLMSWVNYPNNLKLVLDSGRSGAALTNLYFGPVNNHNKLIDYIEDRDLWRHDLNHTKEINAVIQNTEKTFFAYNQLNQLLIDSFDEIVRIGKYLLLQHDRICNDILYYVRPITIHINGEEKYHGFCANCTPQFASDVASKLITMYPTIDFAATYHTGSDGWHKFSLRSTDKNADVSAIAKFYGGGGHRNAAGFTLNDINAGNRINVFPVYTGGGY